MKTALIAFLLSSSLASASMITRDPASTPWNIFGTWVADTTEGGAIIERYGFQPGGDVFISIGDPGPDVHLPTQDHWEIQMGMVFGNGSYIHRHYYYGGGVERLDMIETGPRNPIHGEGIIDVIELEVTGGAPDGTSYFGTWHWHTIPEGGDFALLTGTLAPVLLRRRRR